MMRYGGRPQVPPVTPHGDAVLGHDAAYEPVCHRVADGLFLGSEEAALRPIGELRELGIGAIVNCTKEGTGGTPCAHEAEGVAYCRVDCYDNEGADILSFLAVAAEWIAAHRAASTAVLVHCQMGVSRSSTVAIAAIMLADGCSRDAAYLRVKAARRCIDPNRSFWKQLAQFEEELALRQQGNGARRDSTEPVVDSAWVQRSVAQFGVSPAGVAIGLPISAEGVRAAMRAGVDCWLGRGCDPATGRWLEAVAVHVVRAGDEGDDMRTGALAGLKETLLSPEYMVDWACEMHDREVAATVAMLRSVCAVNASLLVEEPGDQDESGELEEGLRVVRAIRRGLCETRSAHTSSMTTADAVCSRK